MAKVNRRADHDGPHRSAFEKNRKRIRATQNVCYLCGKLVDKSLPQHDPMSAQVDHKIPISKGGHPSDIENLCLVHACCNRAKSDKLFLGEKEEKTVSNQNLPWTLNWFEVAK